MNHKNLEVWHSSIELVKLVYKESHNLPGEEKFNLGSQIRRASVSIPSNIAEGAARNSNKENLHFLNIAMGSTMELETQIILCKELAFDVDCRILLKQINTVRRQLYGLQNHIKTKIERSSSPPNK